MVWGAVGAVLSPVLSVLSNLPLKYKPQPVVLPKGVAAQPETSRADIDQALGRLQPAAWVARTPASRAAITEQCMWRLIHVSKQMAELAVEAKGSYGQGLGEEMLGMFPIVLGLKEYALSLRAGGQRKPNRVRPVPGAPDQLMAEVFPWGMLAALMPGVQGQVWMAPGKPASQGALYQRKKAAAAAAAADGGGDDSGGGAAATPGAISLVLGAGNQLPVIVLDIFHKLIAEDEVVIVKMSPVNEYLGPLLEEALAPLIECGALAIVYGGREVGEYLTSHPLVSSVHLTGSADTFNSIVWGSPSAPRTGDPKLTKRITAELGNVTPFIVVPGPWSAADMRFHARNLVAGLTNNAAHNCIAAEVIVTDKEWPLRDQFLAAVRDELRRLPWRVPYYPGSAAKYDAFKARFQEAGAQVQELGVNAGAAGTATTAAAANPVGSPKPWLLVEGLAPDQASLRSENWCGVLQEVALPGCGGDPAAFMAAAAGFANQQCWGSLAATVWAHPATQKQHADAFHKLLVDLRYGCITVNKPALMGFGITALPWGGAPGNTLTDVESGIGVVHNTFLFDHAVKGVLLGPWRYPTTPLHFEDNYAVPHILPLLMRLLASLDNPAMGLALMTLLTPVVVRG